MLLVTGSNNDNLVIVGDSSTLSMAKHGFQDWKVGFEIWGWDLDTTVLVIHSILMCTSF